MKFFSLNVAAIITLTATFLALSTTQAYERKTQEQKLEGINLTESVTLSELDGTQLKAVAAGIRKKYIMVGINVYVGEILLPSSVTWDKKAATLESSKQAAVQMSFLRDVPGQKISDSFAEGMEENKVDIKTPEMTKFLEVVKKIGDIKEKETVLLARNQTKDSDKLLVLVPGRTQEVISGPAGWTQGIMKIWTGKPADKGLKELQKSLFE